MLGHQRLLEWINSGRRGRNNIYKADAVCRFLFLCHAETSFFSLAGKEVARALSHVRECQLILGGGVHCDDRFVETLTNGSICFARGGVEGECYLE